MISKQPKTFTFINNERLCAIIESAEKRLIYAAPSISESVAKSLYGFAKRDGENAALRVIIDADADAFRLGFGEPAGLELLTQNRVDVRHAAGLRIAIIMADERAWVYSPTPEIILEQPSTNINNAIQVSLEFAEQILLSVAPDVHHRSSDKILSQDIIAENLTPEIGVESLTTEDMIKVTQELKENPPQKFDAMRKVRVYQGYIQFAELSLTGCRLTSHTINIPNSLLNIAENSDLKNRVRSTCRLVENTSEFSNKVKVIQDKVKNLRDDYLKSLGKRYGSVILRKERKEFDKQVLVIQEDLNKLSETVKDDLGKEIESSREKLIVMLLPGFIQNPPQRLKSQLFGEIDKEVARKFIGDELDKQIPTVDKLIGEMKLNCDFKDVTFEMLNDEDFIKLIEAKYPYNNFAKLYSEQEAIGQR